jgi:2-amino-4-hydroxy-6-hydroxymethyldihydropteridine diphosphokinase
MKRVSTFNMRGCAFRRGGPSHSCDGLYHPHIFRIFESFMKQTATHTVAILLGSNLGDRLKQMQQATDLISMYVGNISTVSSYYETKAWGNEDQPDFLNQVLVCETLHKPIDVLSRCLSIEKTLGRDRTEKWGSRTMDIDILYFGQEIIATPELKIPHPFLHERRFTLVPLSEVLPDFVHPVFNLSNKQLLDRCEDVLEVSKLNSIRRSEN